MQTLELFDGATAWAEERIPGAAAQPDRPTPCEEWDTRAVMNHMVDSLNWFRRSALGEDAGPGPAPTPPEVIGDDPVATWREARQAARDVFDDPDVVDKMGPMIAIAAVDQLAHAWDLSVATDQDRTIPADLAEAAFGAVDGQLTDERRGEAFHPAMAVPDDAPVQQRLLGYLGRDASA